MARKKTNPPQTASKLSPINIAESTPIIFSFLYFIFNHFYLLIYFSLSLASITPTIKAIIGIDQPKPIKAA